MKYQSEELQPEFPYQVLAYYWLDGIADPHGLIQAHNAWFVGRDVTARIYINEQGINGQMSIATSDASAYMAWLRSQPGLSSVTFKIQGHHEQAFPRLNVRYRKQLVAIDQEIDLSKGGTHLSPADWKAMLEEKGEKVLIDVRNDYEWKVGHFENAELPECKTFREFNEYAEELKERIGNTETKVMMYCTGGIRCEFYSALLKEKGIDTVYQLDGGVINYGAEENGEHWKGKLFVFDDRLTVPVGEDNKEVVGHCHHCNTSTEKIYNCANTECNELFLCCESCLKEYTGCCQENCQHSPRLRPYQEGQHKPFRRLQRPTST